MSAPQQVCDADDYAKRSCREHQNFGKLIGSQNANQHGDPHSPPNPQSLSASNQGKTKDVPGVWPKLMDRQPRPELMRERPRSVQHGGGSPRRGQALARNVKAAGYGTGSDFPSWPPAACELCCAGSPVVVNSVPLTGAPTGAAFLQSRHLVRWQCREQITNVRCWSMYGWCR